MTTAATATMQSQRRKPVRDLGISLASAADCPLARDLLGQISRAFDQMPTFWDFERRVDATNNVSEGLLCPSAIRRKSPTDTVPFGLPMPKPTCDQPSTPQNSPPPITLSLWLLPREIRKGVDFTCSAVDARDARSF